MQVYVINFKINIISKLVIINIFLLNSCNFNKSINNNIILTINKNNLYTTDLDSEILSNVLKNKTETVNNIVINYLLFLEAKKQKISLDSLVKREIKNYKKSNFKMLGNSILEFDFDDYNVYIDSLIMNNDIDVFVDLQHNSILSAKNIYYFNFGDKSIKDNVYIISDPECSNCINSTNKLLNLVDEFKNISFKYVYYTQPVNDLAIAFYIANEHGLFKEFYKNYTKFRRLINRKELIDVAYTTGLDTVEFKNKINAKTGLIEILKNNQILQKNNIYSTPTFVINNKVYSGSHVIYYLKHIILNEIN